MYVHTMNIFLYFVSDSEKTISKFGPLLKEDLVLISEEGSDEFDIVTVSLLCKSFHNLVQAHLLELIAP